MSLKMSTALANSIAVTGSARSRLRLGFLYLFSGPVPADANAALDMVTLHTRLCKMTVSNDGTTGLDFETTAINGALRKLASQNWSGTNTFVGLNSASSTQLATFFRFIAAADGDNGENAATTQERVQGTIAAAGADMVLTNPTLTAGNVQGLNAAELRFPIG